MIQMTKAAHNDTWKLALNEGRVARFNEGMTMKSYPTKQLAEAALHKIVSAGLDGELVSLNNDAQHYVLTRVYHPWAML